MRRAVLAMMSGLSSMSVSPGGAGFAAFVLKLANYSIIGIRNQFGCSELITLEKLMMRVTLAQFEALMEMYTRYSH